MKLRHFIGGVAGLAVLMFGVYFINLHLDFERFSPVDRGFIFFLGLCSIWTGILLSMIIHEER